MVDYDFLTQVFVDTDGFERLVSKKRLLTITASKPSYRTMHHTDFPPYLERCVQQAHIAPGPSSPTLARLYRLVMGWALQPGIRGELDAQCLMHAAHACDTGRCSRRLRIASDGHKTNSGNAKWSSRILSIS
uniref:Uncharacterized protein n=1 Tax=Coccidioides posadasii RMSCC 3488 TaxID=454284 RepID=A0A0J6FHQ6_COCPO|nr:hypothetical protein CPAG_06161 [Coccidioides posadasii RMSCC 3488]